MAVGVVCQSSARLWSVPEPPRNRLTCARGTELRSSGQSGPARAGHSGPELRSFVAHFEVRNVSTIMATLEALAITQLMFVLCSAPCKARRFAPPARARGLRALTMPARRSVLAIT